MKFQNGGSLTKQDIKNIKGFNLTETFDPIKMWDIVKGSSEVNNFFNSYINSSGFKRIINNQKTWWKKKDIHIENGFRALLLPVLLDIIKLQNDIILIIILLNYYQQNYL